MENLLFYGGVIAMSASLLLLIILLPVFAHRRKSLLRRIENGDVQPTRRKLASVRTRL